MSSLPNRRLCRHTLALMVALSLLTPLQQAPAGLLSRLFAPKAELWERWEAHEPSDRRTIDHSDWSRFLSRYVHPGDGGINRVDYAGVRPEDRRALQRYIDELSAIEISGYSRAAQFGYWVNLYNALTVRVVLDHWPVDSIRDIDLSSGLFAVGPWKRALIEVEGEELALDDIEHRILRPIWRDPRIHYAVNCASIGCPNLQTEAFTPNNRERLLDAAARDYVNHPRGVTPTPDGLILSSIYDWFVDDFDVDGGVVEHLRRYASPDLQARLGGSVAIADYVYDWDLNGLPPR